MINFKNATFIKSAPSYKMGPLDMLPEIIIVGKSNVGKSSLINALVGNKSLAKTSSTPGHTKLLNYFKIDNKFYLVDAPGYGYTKYGNKLVDDFGEMMEEYFKNKDIKGVILLFDSRVPFSKNDLDFYSYLKEIKVPLILVMTKAEKLNQKEKSLLNKNIKLTFDEDDKVILTSVKNGLGMDNLKGAISELLNK